MKTNYRWYGPLLFHLSVLFFLLQMITVGAQTRPPPTDQYPYAARFSPSMAIIIVVLIAALFFMGFFSIYIRHCSDSSGAGGSVRRAISMRARRTAAARGLDRSVIDTFPTFSYSEVKDHKIGKGGLECAVCLNEFEEDETLRLLPKCDHVFHPECIDAWLESHVTCPVCRANLSPDQTQTADESPVQVSSESNDTTTTTTINSRSNSRREDIVIDVDGDQNQQQQQQQGQRGSSSSFEYPNRPTRSWSIQRPFGLGKFRSHSTGHSFVQPGQNLDRFTLRLPEQVRKDVMNRASLNRTRSQIATSLPREGSSRRGYRTGGGGCDEGSSSRPAGGRSYWRIDGGAKSDRWAFFTRALSMKSPKVVAEGGDGGSTTPVVKMPSFKCLEPKAVDEAGLIADHEPARHAV